MQKIINVLIQFTTLTGKNMLYFFLSMNLGNSPSPKPEAQPVSNPISVPAPQSNRNWLIVAFSFFTLLLLASTGYFYYQNQQLKSMLANYQLTPTTSPQSSEPIVSLASFKSTDISNWKKISINKTEFLGKLQFSIPTNVKVCDPSDSLDGAPIPQSLNSISYRNVLSEDNSKCLAPTIFIEDDKFPYGISIEWTVLVNEVPPLSGAGFLKDDIDKAQFTDFGFGDNETLLSSGKTNIVYNLLANNKEGITKEIYYERIIFNKGSYVLVFTIQTDPDKNNLDIYRQILSTFNFLVQDEISGWKVYTDPAKTYSFKYPETWTTQVKCNGGIPNDTYICLKSPNLEQNPVPAVQKGELVTIDSNQDGSYFVPSGPISDFCKETDMNKYKSCNEVTINGIKMIKKVWSNFSFIDVAILDASNTPKVAIRLEYPYPTGYTGVTFDKILSTFQFTQ